jgi:NUMOD3 motif
MNKLEIVHHVDDDPWNHSIENLQAMHTICHNKHHHIGLTHTESDKQKIGQGVARAYAEGRRVAPDMNGEKNPFFGRKHTDETKAKISAACRAAGSTMSIEARARLSALRKGQPRPPRKNG